MKRVEKIFDTGVNGIPDKVGVEIMMDIVSVTLPAGTTRAIGVVVTGSSYAVYFQGKNSKGLGCVYLEPPDFHSFWDRLERRKGYRNGA